MQAKSGEVMPSPLPNATLRKFGYPDNVVFQGSHWAVLVRPAQPTLGSLVLCALGEETSFGDLPAEAFIEQGVLVARIEQTLRRFTRYEKINYLMLMMADAHVHFHVLPRYPGERRFDDIAFEDKGWPGIPDLANTQPAPAALIEAIRDCWRDSMTEEG